MQLKDRVVVITGASRGLGAELARRFADEGCVLSLCARSIPELQKLQRELEVHGAKVAVHKADVSNREEVARLSEETVRRYSRIDIWVNSAGMFTAEGPIEKINWNEVHEMMEVNFFGTAYGCEAAVAQMKKAGGGVVINILSTGALKARPSTAAYSATKFAARGLTESLRAALEEFKIAVISAYPGGMRTGFFGQSKPKHYEDYMDPVFVAGQIVDNLSKPIPDKELIIGENV